ncbi:MAG: DNA primase [Oscillospiraceae bacterium]|nr:DNA primase [Oscillospiraceae bacterium]
MIPDAFIERLRDSCEIESIISSYLTLKRRGRTLTGLCPFHSEKTPSFTVYPDSQSFYCFGCQKGGSAFTFIQEIERLDFVEAIKLLAGRVGLELPEEAGDDGSSRLRTRILEANRAAARFFHEQLIGPGGSEAYGYLTGRGLTRKTIRTFGLGYSPDSWDALTNHLTGMGFNKRELIEAGLVREGKKGIYDQFRGRVIFPILDLRGNVIGFGGRAMEDGKGPKYLNTSDTPVFNKSRNLYALQAAKGVKSDALLLAEGYMDVIALHQAGFTNAVATLGTALTPDQARLIARYAKRAVIAYDSDSAGQNAARRALSLFSGLDLTVSVLEIEGAKDPDEYIKKYGAQRFGTLIEGGKSAFVFEIDRLKQKHDLETPDGKTAFLNEFCALMADISGEIARDVYIAQIARELDVGKDRLSAATEAIRKKRQGSRGRKQADSLRPYVQDTRPSEGRRTAVDPKADLSGLAAERGMLALLMQNPDYYGEIQSKLTEKDFADPDHAAIYQALRIKLEEQAAPDLALIGPYLDSRQMGIVSGLLTSGQEVKYYREQAEEFLMAIHRQKTDKSPDELGKMSPQQLKEYINTRRAAKS